MNTLIAANYRISYHYKGLVSISDTEKPLSLPDTHALTGELKKAIEGDTTLLVKALKELGLNAAADAVADSVIPAHDPWVTSTYDEEMDFTR